MDQPNQKERTLEALTRGAVEAAQKNSGQRGVHFSAIANSELLYGIEVSPLCQQDEAALNAFLRYVEVVNFPHEAAPHYAKICADLKTRGTIIATKNLFVAAHARSLGLTLVTNNTSEFGRLPKRVIQNWTRADKAT